MRGLFAEQPKLVSPALHGAATGCLLRSAPDIAPETNGNDADGKANSTGEKTRVSEIEIVGAVGIVGRERSGTDFRGSKL